LRAAPIAAAAAAAGLTFLFRSNWRNRLNRVNTLNTPSVVLVWAGSLFPAVALFYKVILLLSSFELT
jgi:hypothetical protein